MADSNHITDADEIYPKRFIFTPSEPEQPKVKKKPTLMSAASDILGIAAPEQEKERESRPATPVPPIREPDPWLTGKYPKRFIYTPPPDKAKPKTASPASSKPSAAAMQVWREQMAGRASAGWSPERGFAGDVSAGETGFAAAPATRFVAHPDKARTAVDLFTRAAKVFPVALKATWARWERQHNVPAPGRQYPAYLDNPALENNVYAQRSKKKYAAIQHALDQAAASSRSLLEYAKNRYGEDYEVLPGIAVRDIAGLPDTLAYSALTAGAGLATGLAVGAATRSKKLAYLAGGAAAGKVAYDLNKDQFLEQIIQQPLDALCMQKKGRHMTPDEWRRIAARFDAAATKHSLIEAGYEAIGDAIGFGLWEKPAELFFRTGVVRNRLLKMIAKAGVAAIGSTATELLSEAATYKSQGGIEHEIGARKTAPTVGESFREVAPTVLLLQAIMGPTFGGTHVALRALDAGVSHVAGRIGDTGGGASSGGRPGGADQPMGSGPSSGGGTIEEAKEAIRAEARAAGTVPVHPPMASTGASLGTAATKSEDELAADSNRYMEQLLAAVYAGIDEAVDRAVPPVMPAEEPSTQEPVGPETPPAAPETGEITPEAVTAPETGAAGVPMENPLATPETPPETSSLNEFFPQLPPDDGPQGGGPGGGAPAAPSALEEKYAGRNKDLGIDIQAIVDDALSETKSPRRREFLRRALYDHMLGDYGVVQEDQITAVQDELEANNIPYTLEMGDGENLGGVNKHAGSHDAADELLRQVWGEIYVKEAQKYGAVVGKKKGGDEFKVLWPNLTKAEVEEIRADIDEKMAQRIAELGLSGVPHPKHDYMPTGAGRIDSGFAEWSPENPAKRGELEREADEAADLKAEGRYLDVAEKEGYIYNKRRKKYVRRKSTKEAGNRPEPSAERSVQGAGQESQGPESQGESVGPGRESEEDRSSRRLKEQPSILPGDILQKRAAGPISTRTPFSSREQAKAAIARQGKTDTHEAVQVGDGQWVGREKPERKYAGRNKDLGIDIQAIVDDALSETKSSRRREFLRRALYDHMLGDYGVVQEDQITAVQDELEANNIPYTLEMGDGANLGGVNKHAGSHAEADRLLQQIWGEIYTKEARKYGAVVGKKKGGDEFKVLWPNLTKAEVEEIRADIDRKMEQRIAELGLDRIPHPKHNYMPTGAGRIDSGFAEWSPENPAKRGELEREADHEADLKAGGRYLDIAEKEGYVFDKERESYVKREKTKKAGIRPSHTSEQSDEGISEEDRGPQGKSGVPGPGGEGEKARNTGQVEEPPSIQPGDILHKRAAGPISTRTPFSSREQAEAAIARQGKTDTHQAVQVGDGQWVGREKQAAPPAKPRQTKKEKALAEYRSYVDSLSEDQRKAVSHLIEDNPARPASLLRRIKQALAGKQGAAQTKQPWEMTQEEYNKSVFTIYEATPEQFEKIKENWVKATGDKIVLKYKTPQEFAQRTGVEEFFKTTLEPAPILHKEEVEKAFKEGKPVPAEVLKDYPDLVKEKELAESIEPYEKTDIKKPNRSLIDLVKKAARWVTVKYKDRDAYTNGAILDITPPHYKGYEKFLTENQYTGRDMTELVETARKNNTQILPEPVAVRKDKNMTILYFNTPDGLVAVNKAHYDYFKSKHKDSILKYNPEDPSDPVIVYRGQKPAGLLMPLKNEAVTPELVEKALGKEGIALYQTNQAITNFTGISLKELRELPFIKGKSVTINKDGHVEVKFAPGKTLTIKGLTGIGKNKVKVHLGVAGKGAVKTAMYYDKTVTFTLTSDIKTAFHEIGGHFFEDIGLINNADKTALNEAIYKETGKRPGMTSVEGQEARATWIADNLAARAKFRETRVGKVLQKIADFIDSLVNLYHKTARGVLRKIEKGQDFEKAGVFEFAQSPLVDNPNILYEQRKLEKLAEKKKLFKSYGAQIKGNKVVLYRGGNISASELKKLRYGDYLSAVKYGTDKTGNLGADSYGKTIIRVELPITDVEVAGTGEFQYKGEAKSLKGGRKYPLEIYKAYNDYYGSNYTAEEIDEMDNVRMVASMGLEGGRDEFDALMEKHVQSPSFSLEETTSQKTGLTKETLKETIEPTLSKTGVKANYVQSEDELPAEVRAAASNQNANGRVVAAYHQGEIWFVADNIHDEKSAQSALLHELFGHHGIEAVLSPADATRFYNQVWEAKLNDPVFRRLAESYGADLTTKEGRITTAKEYVAHIAESGVDDTLLTRLIGIIRDALRKLGFNLKINDNDIRRLIAIGAKQVGKSSVLVPDATAFQKYASTWYSKMEQVLADKLPGKGTGKSFASTIQSWARKGMFKQEELEWSGLLDWLEGKDKVTKTEVLDWLAENNVRIEEVHKKENAFVAASIVDEDGDRVNLYLREEENPYYEDAPGEPEYYYWEDEDGNDIGVRGDSKTEAIQNLEDVYRYGEWELLGSWMDDGNFPKESLKENTQYSDYVTPGGENYRELLITLPTKEDRSSWRDWVKGKIAEGEVSLNWLHENNAPEHVIQSFERHMFPAMNETPLYKSSHWEEPNVLVHVRFKERTGPNGERVLFIEEVQSDWMSDIRKRGRSIPIEKMSADELREKMLEQDIFAGDEHYLATLSKPELIQLLEQEAQNSVHGKIAKEAVEKHGVPDAPWQKSYYLKAMQRMVRYAAENGFDVVAWTPGRVHYRRWGSEKVAWKRQGPDSWLVYVKDQSGGQVAGIDIETEADARGLTTENSQKITSKKELKDLIRIIAKREEGQYTPARFEAMLDARTDKIWKRMQEEDAGVSLPRKESFENIYDKILPTAANKFFNKKAWGNAKAEPGKISEEQDAWILPVTPEMRDKALTEGMPLFKLSGGETLLSVENKKPWPDDFPNTKLHTTVAGLTGHPDYGAAKAGDVQAAVRVARDLVNVEKARELGEKYPDAVLVPVMAVEEAGHNKLPLALAHAIGDIAGLAVDDNIYQESLSGRSGKNGFQRLLTPVKFEGTVKKGGQYILVDDVTTQGGTFSELRHYIENNGGRVVATTAFGGGRFSARLAVRPETITQIEGKFGREETEKLLREYDIAGTLEALTEGQARQLLKFSSLDSIRTRIAEEGYEGSLPQDEGGVQGSSLTSLSVLQGAVLDEKGVAELQAIARDIDTILRRVLPAKGYKRVRAELKPIIDLSGRNLEKTLAEHGGTVTAEQVLGATTLQNLHALIELAYGYDSDTIKKTVYHELYHVARRWLFDDKTNQRMAGAFGNNEEAEAEAFAEFAAGKDAAGKTPFVRRIFNSLRRILKAFRNFLQGRGYFTPEDVFDRLYKGKYKMQPADTIMERTSGTPETGLSVEGPHSGAGRVDERLKPPPGPGVSRMLLDRLKALDPRVAWQKYVGDPVWKFFAEDAPQALGRKVGFIDAISRGLIVDYRKDPEYIKLRDATERKIRQATEAAKELARIIAAFPRAEQVRIGQIIEGSITVAPKRYEAALKAAEEFKRLEAELQELGLLGPDNRFRQLTRRELAAKWKEIRGIEAEIEKLRASLSPTTKVVRRRIRRATEAVTHTIERDVVSDGGAEDIATKVSRAVELNEQRVKEALLNRGFGEGEAEQMINRIKRSVIVPEDAPGPGSASEIRTTVKKIVERTVTEEVTKTKTYSRRVMARARGSIVKEINKLEKQKAEILGRISTHYKMAGKQYLRMVYDTVEDNKGLVSALRAAAKKYRLRKGYDIRRKDLDAKWKWDHRLGTPALVMKGLSAEAHDAELMRLFVRIAKNSKWAMTPEEWSAAVQDNPEMAAWKPLPAVDRLGPLAGMMCDPYIYDDLNQAVEHRNEIVRVYDELLRLWKSGKVVFNPASQARNLMSNTILAYMADLPPWRVDIYARAAKSLKTRDEVYKTAVREGLIGTEWAGHEIASFLDEMATLSEKDGSLTSQAVRLTKKLLDTPGKTYQGIEQFFKLAVFLDQKEKGASDADAAAHATKWLFDYTKVPPAIRWAKRWYSPFITFTYKAMPRVAETAVRKPWKMVFMAAGLYAVEAMTRRLLGQSKEDEDRERRVLPDYMQRSALPGFPSHVRVPYTDSYGRTKYLDISYILPWGDIGEMWGQSRIRLVPRAFMPSHPLWIIIAEVGFNETLFTGQPLSEDWQTTGDYAKKLGMEIWRQIMPSLAPGGYSFNKLVSAATGEKDWAGRDRSLPEAVFDTLLGLKIRSVDYNEELERRLYEQQDNINSLSREFVREYRRIVLQAPSKDPDRQRRREMKLYEKYSDSLERIIDHVTRIAE